MHISNKGSMNFLNDETWRNFLDDIGITDDHAINELSWKFSFKQQSDQSFMTEKQKVN